MSYYQFNLKAGVPMQRPVIGKLVLVDDIVGADSVDITMQRGGAGVTLPNRKRAFKFWQDYDTIILVAGVDCIVKMFLGTSDVSLGFTETVNVQGGVSIINGLDKRVPVDLAGGSVTVTADNVGISNGDDNPVPVRPQLLGTLADMAAVAVNTGAAQMVVADTTLRRLRFRNAHAIGNVALGGPGVTMANAAIVLGPGEMWLEDDAPGAAWFAVSDTAGVDLRLMGVKQ